MVLLAVMLVSGAMSIHSWMEDKRTRGKYERLAELARGDHCAAVHGSRDRARDRRAGDRALCISINFEEELMRRIRIPSDGYGCRIPTLIIPLFRERTTIST